MKRWISCIGYSCVRRTSPSNAMNLMVGRFAMTTTAHTLYTKSPAFYVPVRRKVAHRTKEYSDEANNFQDGDEEKETRSRGRPRRLGEGYEEELAQLEQAEKGISSVEDTEAALHQMEYIPEELINTIRSLKIVSEFRAGNCKDRIRRVCALLSNTHRVQHMGNCLYFRVVHKMGGPNGHRSGPEKAMKQVVEHIHKILGEFTVSTISLTPNEVVGDVTNYGHATPLLMAATTNLKQYIRDVDAVVTAHNFEKVPTYPPPSEEELIPYQSDEIAKDVAFRLREYIQKVVCDTRVAVCIGVANTAAMAKIACEAEVTALTRQQANGGNSSSVRVRSFSRYLHSIDSAQEFVKKLPVSCIPTFTPAFIEMLQSVFGIVNCQQLSDELEMLFFCFGRTTFVACYDAIFGRMRFPEEDNVLLFSHHSHTNFPVLIDSLARNSVTITNASRTAVSGSVLSSSRESRRTRKVGWIEMSKGYGRLISDAELTKVVETLATSMHRELLQRSMYVETVRLELQVDGEIHYRAFTTIQRTQSRALIGRGVTALLSKALAHRARSRSSTMSAGTNVVAITFQKLTARSMLPPGMVKEMEETIAMYLHHRMRLKSSAAYARIRKGEKYVPAHRLEAPKEHKINPTYRKIAARLSSG